MLFDDPKSKKLSKSKFVKRCDEQLIRIDDHPDSGDTTHVIAVLKYGFILP